jgi:hypothetical protein
MRILVLTLLLTQVAQAEVIDLGSLVIEGEVRRPMVTKIVSKQHTDKLILENAKKRLVEIEEELLKKDDLNEN